MSVVIHNLQRSIRLDLWRMERDVRYLRRLMGLTSFHIGIQCVEDDDIADANLAYRGVEGTTDVLAFPLLEEMEPGQSLPEIPDPDSRLLGDLMLGIPYIHKHAKLHGEQLEQTLNVMVLHGMCHLIGYDHETKDQWQQMYYKELMILDQFNQTTGYNCKPLLGIGHGERFRPIGPLVVVCFALIRNSEVIPLIRYPRDTQNEGNSSGRDRAGEVNTMMYFPGMC